MTTTPPAAAPREVTIVANPAAGRGRARAALPRVAEALRATGATVEIVESRDLGHAVDEAGAAARAGYVVAALGGDGTVGAVAGAVAAAGGALAVLPCGRGNDTARTLGMPLDPVRAARALGSVVERRIDLGCAGDRPFVGIASVGFDGEANRIANDCRWLAGRLVYPYATLRALAAWRPAAFAVTVDGVESSFTGYLVSVANTPSYGGGMRIAPDADPADGLLDVVTVAHVSKPRFLTIAPRIFSGGHVRDPSVDVARGRAVRLDADRPFIVYGDGDPLGALPITVTVRPGALRVLVPAGLEPVDPGRSGPCTEPRSAAGAANVPPSAKDHGDAG
jgi:YegS/Rv2252/BmrU family lipid kinase